MSPPHHSRKKRRSVRAISVEAADALLSLPSDILDEILTRLDLRNAVRTSALSRAWRRRWESLPSLDMSFPLREDGECPGKTLGAVDGILLRCPGRVRRFDIGLDELSAHRVHDWLLVLSRRGIEILSLWSNNFFAVHSSVFSCGSLAALELSTCEIPLLPLGFAGFPNLRKLSLENVRLHENGEYQLEEIIETSPLLEELMLCDVSIGGDEFIKWVIQAPNLRHLTISSNYDYGCILEEMPRLRSAVIELWNYIGARRFAKLLAGVVHAKKLLLTTFYAPSNGAKILETIPCTFHNLKWLVLTTHFCELPPILFTFCLLASAPNLEKLEILIWVEEQNVEANSEFQNAQWTDGMCANLQVVNMTGINWLPNEMSFMQLILSKAKLLRVLSVTPGGKIAMSNEDALIELLRHKTALSQAQILLKGQEED